MLVLNSCILDLKLNFKKDDIYWTLDKYVEDCNSGKDPLKVCWSDLDII